jgi:hypothetical protein
MLRLALPRGYRLGAYVVHYADGQEHVIPIVYGEDVRDWNGSNDTMTETPIALWSGVQSTTPASRSALRHRLDESNAGKRNREH